MRTSGGWKDRPRPKANPTQLQRIRIERGMTQAELCRCTGLGANFVSLAEKGSKKSKRGINIIDAAKMARALHISLDEWAEAYEADRGNG